jgi:phage terminase large subunit-like protein
MRFLFSCSTLGKEAAKLRKLKRYKPTKFMAEGSRYDKEAADAAVTFINCLKHTKGEWYGMPFELIDWQEQIVRDIFGILKPNGYRQFNTAYIEIPKKQGKSELAAAIGLITYVICEDEYEIISLNSLEEGKGIGSSLVKETEKIALRNRWQSSAMTGYLSGMKSN